MMPWAAAQALREISAGHEKAAGRSSARQAWTGSATTDSRTRVSGSARRPNSYRIEAFERVGNVPPAANERDSFLSDRDVADDDDVALPGVARVAGTCQPDRPLALRHQP